MKSYFKVSKKLLKHILHIALHPDLSNRSHHPILLAHLFALHHPTPLPLIVVNHQCVKYMGIIIILPINAGVYTIPGALHRKQMLPYKNIWLHTSLYACINASPPSAIATSYFFLFLHWLDNRYRSNSSHDS